MVSVNLKVCAFFCRYRNYREVYDGRKIVIRQEATNLTLIIKNVEFADAGDVECQARNKYGAVSIRAKLHVLGELKES